jgi:hypothetical protein
MVGEYFNFEIRTLHTLFDYIDTLFHQNRMNRFGDISIQKLTVMYFCHLRPFGMLGEYFKFEIRTLRSRFAYRDTLFRQNILRERNFVKWRVVMVLIVHFRKNRKIGVALFGGPYLRNHMSDRLEIFTSR